MGMRFGRQALESILEDKCRHFVELIHAWVADVCSGPGAGISLMDVSHHDHHLGRRRTTKDEESRVASSTGGLKGDVISCRRRCDDPLYEIWFAASNLLRGGKHSSREIRWPQIE